jgi:hypothetical protein
MKVKPNQLVAALTPVVFAPLAGAISVFAAQHAGVDIDASSLQAVFIAGATIALAKAALWLRGWQEYEKRLPLPQEQAAAAADEPAGAPDVPADDGLDGFLDDDLDDADEPLPAVAVG